MNFIYIIKISLVRDNKTWHEQLAKRNFQISWLSNEQPLECEKCITEKELFEALKSMPNDKYPGNYGLTKTFLEMFWSEVEKNFLSCILHFFVKKNSVSHKDKQL